MVATPTKETQQSPSTQRRKETILSPRFYTTDFEAMAKMDITDSEADYQAILEEFKADYNRRHFRRDKDFDQSWEHLDDRTKQAFRVFLEGSCTSEFSGFLLYKEIAVKLKDKSPLMAECFSLMSRDEARHAGFLNKAMPDFNLQIDLSVLSKSKQYVYFAPKFIFYATYLSEKIGYWRYIKIHQHLAKNPENRIYPIFKFFENWCQDENRHGDFCNLLLKSQPQFVSDWRAKLWCRFFLLSVFATMYLNDICNRSDFYEAIGLDTQQYVEAVLRDTNEESARAFPVILDLENPKFWSCLEKCVAINGKLKAIAESNQPKVIKKLRALPHYVANGWQFVTMYLLKPIDVDKAAVL
ncbi:Mg-protoporphyrin IX monomethyl ester (oxidative) cyclase [Thalassoporum mexicanum PCC 7367]|uniref:magnesium-protoporphyrin IX monomethyl ester (oxidative) cyclase n=1 Tax=Thalassoporum mexicanum TaxID=3457544 RepID=UPI00029FAF9A|nr:magnesium-protoporphyrin IX monomethyl ester (oxidative) cyclase [Pseudanabaena sp. PCC 7367]AFY71407.1 Mg-protoporphyrin IX monomethyl ester (oxidative) cyclase [Pseudanabaena sp. PCC 7367]